MLLSGCATTDSKQASLPDLPKSKTEPHTRVAAAPVPIRLPEERATEPQIAAAGEPVTMEPQQPALDTPPAEVATTVAPPQEASLDELVMAPTGASASSNSIFASRQMAYAPEQASGSTHGSTSLVPTNLPVRSGINPSAGSLFSAPGPPPPSRPIWSRPLFRRRIRPLNSSSHLNRPRLPMIPQSRFLRPRSRRGRQEEILLADATAWAKRQLI